MTNVVDQKVPIHEEPASGNLAANCGQIFAKGPQLTKEIVSKVKRTELGNERKFLCGHEFKTRHIWILSGLLILFTFSLTGTILFWGTNFFRDVALQNLVLRNGTDSFDSFITPKVGPFYKVHIFNYTNVDEFERGIDDKLRVEDIGPYVFQEKLERVNVVVNDDDTITFQEKRSYVFRPEMSNGRRQSDQFVVPNLPLLGTVSMVKDALFLTRVSVASIFRGLNAKPFLKLPAQRFIWGYDDSLFSLVKSIVSFQRELPFEKFGLLAPKIGTSKDRITVDTGAKNLDDLGKIVRINNQERMNHWSTDECNSIDGTLGSLFSPYTVHNKQPVNIFQKDICRKLFFEYQKEVELLNSFKAYRYTPPAGSFAHPDIEPKNQCFCEMETGVCPPHGIINATPCAFGPAYLSSPHFLNGDEKLRSDVIGLEPDEEKHSSYLDLHPTFGYTMAGYTKLQLNFLVRKAYAIPETDMFEDKTMIPIAWFDNGMDAEDMPQSILDIFCLTSVTLPILEVALKYGCLLMALTTFVTIVLIIQGRLRSKRPIRTMRRIGGIPPFQRNISGLDALIN